MGAKFFYRDIDLVYFVNNKLISSAYPSTKMNHSGYGVQLRKPYGDLINQKDRVLLSFSGGQDSICFAFILNQLYCQLELDVTFFWCHHLWQTDSFYLMQQIAKLSFLLQFNSCFPIPLNCISSELLARKWRQNCSYRVSLFYNYSKICLAHTFNDKVENIFLNFIRGTGLIGLAPLRWIQLAKRISKSTISETIAMQAQQRKPKFNMTTSSSTKMNPHLNSLSQRYGFNLVELVDFNGDVVISNEKDIYVNNNVIPLRKSSIPRAGSIYSKSNDPNSILPFNGAFRFPSAIARVIPFRESSIPRHNYLNSLSSFPPYLRKGSSAAQAEVQFSERPEGQLNGPNMCTSSLQGNSDKLKNLTKKVIIKFIRKGFAPLKCTPTKTHLVRGKQRGLPSGVHLGKKHQTFWACEAEVITNIRFVQKIHFSGRPISRILCIPQLRKPKFILVGATTKMDFGLRSWASFSGDNDIIIKNNFNKTTSTSIQNLFYNSNKKPVKGKLLLSLAPKTLVQSKGEDDVVIYLYEIEDLQRERRLFTQLNTNSRFVSNSLTQLLKPLSRHLYKPSTSVALERNVIVLTNDVVSKSKFSESLTLLYERPFVAKDDVVIFDLYNKQRSVGVWGKQLLNGCYIVRPLLSISRIELNKICYFWELPIYPDKSNQKVKFLRNRVRGQLLPIIKLFFNLNIENIFLQLAKIVETEDYCLTQIVNEFTKNTDVYNTKVNIYPKIMKRKW